MHQSSFKHTQDSVEPIARILSGDHTTEQITQRRHTCDDFFSNFHGSGSNEKNVISILSEEPCDKTYDSFWRAHHSSAQVIESTVKDSSSSKRYSTGHIFPSLQTTAKAQQIHSSTRQHQNHNLNNSVHPVLLSSAQISSKHDRRTVQAHDNQVDEADVADLLLMLSSPKGNSNKSPLYSTGNGYKRLNDLLIDSKISPIGSIPLQRMSESAHFLELERVNTMPAKGVLKASPF